MSKGESRTSSYSARVRASRLTQTSLNNVSVIQRPKAIVTFDEADRRFRNDPTYLNNAEVTDEIWFFFDVETVDIPKWSGRLRIISRLRKLRKKPGIRIRLLMTTGVLNTGSCYTMSIWHLLSAQLRTRSVC